MKVDTKLGIWMDHSEAHLVEFSIDKKDIRIIQRDHSEGAPDPQKHSEKQHNNKKRNYQEAFYKKIWTVAHDYKEVLLFGPTDAKTEFFNQIRGNHANDSVKVSLRSMGKMNHDEMHDFVYRYFKPIMLP
jgi:stalled ribosome rescue protein Dom34